tara:strand:- start:1685 stop:3379 length:1695 start_codon:yes stop_codon:yes gene_type:complete
MKNIVKFILIIFLFFCESNLVHSRNLDKYYKSDKISNYFSGLLSLYDNEYASSYKFLKELEGLEDKHSSYPTLYQFSLINSGKIYEAYKYSKKLENKKLESYEGNLIIGIYHLKNNRFNEAYKYFKKLDNNKNSQDTIQNLVSTSLKNWMQFANITEEESYALIKKFPKRFNNIKKIQTTLAKCYFNSLETNSSFMNLISDQNTDFSRYSFFYANFLKKNSQTNKALEIVDLSLKTVPRNLILLQLKEDIKNNSNFFFNEFDCRNLTNVAAEILYILANALSSQSSYTLSNFYLNLSKYLNQNFKSFDSLYAENFYMMNKLNLSKNIYKSFIDKGSIYSWHASKEIAKILIEQNKTTESLNFLKKNFNNFQSPNINQIFDYARFLKNNEKFDEAIKYYTKVLNLIDKKHYLYPKATEGRGVSYERIGKWEKAEKDLLNSLSVSPEQAYVINYLAYSWIEKGVNIEKSLEMLKKANDLKKNDGYIVDSLGWALFKLERYKEAEKYLRLAVTLMPSDPIVNDHYGDVLWMNNEKIKARYYWHYVLNLEKTEEKLKKIAKNKTVFGL